MQVLFVQGTKCLILVAVDFAYSNIDKRTHLILIVMFSGPDYSSEVETHSLKGIIGI